jgi:hypothetical protein
MLFRAEADFSMTADWEGLARLEVQAGNGDVEVFVSDGDQIRVSGTKWVRGNTLEEARRKLEQVTVQASPAADDPSTFLVESSHPPTLRTSSPGAAFVVEVPRGCPATIHTANGKLRVEGLAGEVRLDTSNGRIDAKDINGTLRAESSNGRITVRGVVGDTRVTASNGTVDVADLRGSLDVRTTNGAIRAQVTPPADGHVELHTSNGSIQLTVPKDLPADLRLSSSNGRVRARLERVSLGGGSSSNSITWGVRFEDLAVAMNGGGCRVEATTSNGSITLNCR